MRTYKAKDGAQFNNNEAQQLGEVIESIDGEVTPQSLIDKARNVTSPIHHLFEWDNSKAADRWRVVQARNMLNHLEVIIVVDDQPCRAKAFHNVTIRTEQGASRGYVDVTKLQESPELLDQVIARALREAKSWMIRYQDYASVFDRVFREINQLDQLQERITKAKRRKRQKAAT